MVEAPTSCPLEQNLKIGIKSMWFDGGDKKVVKRKRKG
jgi:hypothetical protein